MEQGGRGGGKLKTRALEEERREKKKVSGEGNDFRVSDPIRNATAKGKEKNGFKEAFTKERKRRPNKADRIQDGGKGMGGRKKNFSENSRDVTNKSTRKGVSQGIDTEHRQLPNKCFQSS